MTYGTVCLDDYCIPNAISSYKSLPELEGALTLRSRLGFLWIEAKHLKSLHTVSIHTLTGL